MPDASTLTLRATARAADAAIVRDLEQRYDASGDALIVKVWRDRERMRAKVNEVQGKYRRLRSFAFGTHRITRDDERRTSKPRKAS